MSVQPKELTKHAVKRICESSNVADEFENESPMIFQVVSSEIFDENRAKKNIKGKVQISDGTSKMLVMMSDKAYNAIVDSGAGIEKHSIWALNVSKQQIQTVKNQV